MDQPSGAMEIISGYATKPGATLSNVTAFTGDSFQVRNAPKNAYLFNVWSRPNVAGFIEIRSTRLHDVSHGIRVGNYANSNFPLLPPGFSQPLIAQDTLTIQMTGSTVSLAQENLSMQMYYPVLPGTQQRLIDTATLRSRFVNYLAQNVAITCGTTAGTYGGTALINATYNTFKANTDYAVIGGGIDLPTTIETEAGATTVVFYGADTGNLRLGFPADPANKNVAQKYFVDLTEQYKIPLIPVINSANVGNTYVQVVNNQGALSPNVTLFLAELRT
jgi:hypothetical protein